MLQFAPGRGDLNDGQEGSGRGNGYFFLYKAQEYNTGRKSAVIPIEQRLVFYYPYELIQYWEP